MLLQNINLVIPKGIKKIVFFSCIFSSLSLFAIEKTIIVENATQFQMDLKDQLIDVKSLTIQNLSDSTLEKLFLTVNEPRDKKYSESVNYLKENGFYKWFKKYQIHAVNCIDDDYRLTKNSSRDAPLSSNFNGVKTVDLYDYSSGFKLNTPLRHIPGFTTSKEYYYNEEWHLINEENKAAFLCYDNETAKNFDTIADDPFLILRTKTSQPNQQYSLKDSSLTLAKMNIFESCIDHQEDVTQEEKYSSIYCNLHSLEKIKFTKEDVLEQHLIVKSDGAITSVKSLYPVDSIKNESAHPLFLDNHNIAINPKETYTFEDSVYSIDLGIDESANIVLYSKNVKAPSICHLNDTIYLNTDSKIKLMINIDYDNLKASSVDVESSKTHFDHEIPYFKLTSEKSPKKIHWQIAKDSSFDYVYPNFDSVCDYEETIRLNQISDTFLNNHTTYYFRIKSLDDNLWSAWSSPFSFTVSKPEPVKNVSFSNADHQQFTISWTKSSDENTDYLVFASNDLDFIPEIYNLDDSEVSTSNNFICQTTDNSIHINDEYAFYRIVAKNKNHYSIPSEIIRVYDRGLKIPRSVIQATSINDTVKISRVSFPIAYPEIDLDEDEFKSRVDLKKDLFASKYYTPSPYVDSVTWNSLEPLLLPENHPEKAKLDRLFRTRVTESESSLKKAGFTNPKPMRYSKTIVTRNKKFPGYIFKFYSDEQKINDAEKCAKRVIGSIHVQNCIDKHQINHLFVVPKKYLYPIPADPGTNGKYRKNYIVFENEIKIYVDKANNKMWKSPAINKNNLFWLYVILNEVGLSDSAFSFNIPVTKDNRIAFVDTEHFHKWPVPFFKLELYLSSEMKDYWKTLYKKK